MKSDKKKSATAPKTDKAPKTNRAPKADKPGVKIKTNVQAGRTAYASE